MAQKLKNNARALLTSAISAGDTSLVVESAKADSFPAADTGTDPVGTFGKDWFKAVLQDTAGNVEIIYVRTRPGGNATMSNILRGQEGTTARDYAAGSIVGLRITAQDVEESIDLSSQATEAGKAMLFADDADAQAQLISGAIQKNTATAFTTSGNGTAYAITPTPAVTAYVANLAFDVTFHVASGNNPTLQISGLATPPNLVRRLANGGYTNIKSGKIPVGQRSRVVLISPTQALVENPRESMDGVAGADIASAATLDLTARDGNILIVTGTTATSEFQIEPGGRAELIAPAGWQLTYNATTNPVQGGQNYICQAGDRVVVSADGDGDLHVQVIEALLPGKAVGEIFDYAGATAPPGALVCPTSQTNLSRTTYARLFAAIGTTWGNGDGSTTFGMPWFPADYASVQANANVGTSSVGQVISHSHTIINVSSSGSYQNANIAASNATYGSRLTEPAGGAANLPAGVRTLKCVKF